MPDINWNGDAASAPYISRYDQVNDNLVLAETNAGTVLLEYDGTQWNATDLDVAQLGAGTVNTVRRVRPSDANLQTVVDEVSASDGGTIILDPGIHSNHSYPITITDSNITIRGFSAGSSDDHTDHQGESNGTVLDAGGGEAIRTENSTDRIEQFELSNVGIHGTWTVPSGTMMEGVAINTVTFNYADASVGSGRGLNVQSTDWYNVDMHNVGAYNNDNASFWINNIGQSRIDHLWSYSSGATDSEPQMVISPSTTTMSHLYVAAGGITGTTGITIDAPFRSELYGGFSEQHDIGLEIRNGLTPNTAGGPMLVSGGTWSGDTGPGVAISDDATSQFIHGADLSDVGAVGSANSGTAADVKYGSNARDCILGRVYRQSNQGANRSVDVEWGGFNISPMAFFHTQGTGAVDTSTLFGSSSPEWAMEVDDGTNTSSGNPGFAYYDGSAWYYTN